MPEIDPSTSSTASLIDVDTPSVRTVPSDFLEQDVQTDTQAARLEREGEALAKQAAERARAEADLAKKKTKSAVADADSYLTKWFSSLDDNQATAVVGANLLAVVGLSGFLGYKGWSLYDKGRLSWGAVGLGVGVVAIVGGVEALFTR